MTRLFTVALALSIVSPASAAQALWKQTNHWTISGDTQTGVCIAETIYPAKGQSLLIAEGSIGWSLFLTGTNAVAGGLYRVDVATSSGGVGEFQGKGLSDGLVMFKNLDRETMWQLAKARQLAIEGLGAFNLTGSFEAILETHACFLAVTGEMS